ncbi:VOC family protein [Pseudomonas sp. GV071]|uniref:VOC family protein n=1 Tax=Pseudomonas sp. GV071 TaxID=2135754 RepID=UPI000D3D7DF0|nr:VOC family protein [Pseudomonas sp. GV071]PTQ72122.1 putative enzyme related to lactoylglutathione lyase [Pseudomonas sp. GV071]
MNLLLNIDVPDLAAGIAFYTEAFGLHLSRHLFDGEVAELLGGPTPIYLLANPTGSRPCKGAARHYQRHWTPIHFDIVVDDLTAACDRAIAAGATLEAPIRHEAWCSIATFGDPFGHGFCLLQWQGRGYDEVES